MRNCDNDANYQKRRPNFTSDMWRISAASFLGTAIEFYDIQIYSLAAAMVFAPLFFPELGEIAGTVAAFGTIGVSFVARPIGSVIFGHFGDRLGRKQTLIVTLLLMGVSTLLVGLLPTGQQIGIAAPIILIILRVVQGCAAGGEYAGAAIMLGEHAPRARRASWACIPHLGGAASLLTGGLTMAVTTFLVTEKDFQSWGWRIPFLLSALILVIGLYIRLKINESPIFEEEIDHQGAARIPIAEAINAQTKNFFLATVVSIPPFIIFYLIMTYVVNFGSEHLNINYTVVPIVMSSSGLVLALGVCLGAWLSDLYGRRPVLIIGNTFATVWVLILFPLLSIATVFNFVVSVVLSAFISGVLWGPTGALMCELFRTRYRYSAIGVCYSLAGIVGGAAPPLVAGPIIAHYGNLTFSCILALVIAPSIACALTLDETKMKDLKL